MSGIGAFLNGMVEGRERRRRWETENEDREWDKNRRGRQLVLDGQQDEDRLSDNAWEQEERGNTRTVWNRDTQRFGREQVEWGQQDEDRTTRLEDEAYTRGRTRAADRREDADLAALIAAGNAAADAMAAANSTAPVIPEYQPAQAPQPGVSGPVAPYQPGQPPIAGSGNPPPPAAAPGGRSLFYGDAVGALPRDPLTADQSPYEVVGPLPVDPPNAAVAPAPAQPAPVQAGRSLPSGLDSAANMVGSRQAPTQPAPAAPAAPQPAAAPSPAEIAATQLPSAPQGRGLPPPAQQVPQPTAAPAGAGRLEQAVNAAQPSAAPQAAAATAPATQPRGRALPINTEPPERQARRADAGAAAFEQYYRSDGAPKVVEHYLRTGQIEKAETFRKFIETGAAQENIRHLGRAMTYIQVGNPKAAFDTMLQVYNSPDYYQDGQVALPDQSWIEQDPATGRLTGKITIQDERTGSIHEIPIDGADDLYRIGIGMLSPESVFEQAMEALKKPGFRPATPEEAAAYGATGGQFGPDGRFYDIKPPSGLAVETGPDGQVRVVQGAGAQGATGKPFTEAQSKDNIYATRAEGALATLDPLAGALPDRGAILADKVPLGMARGAQSDQYQVARVAADEFLQAILRKDTGAAITAQEQDLYGKTYLPQPGDGEAAMAQKTQARRRAVEALKAGMSPAQIIAQEKALQASGSEQLPPINQRPGETPPAKMPEADSEGWTDMGNGVKIRVK